METKNKKQNRTIRLIAVFLLILSLLSLGWVANDGYRIFKGKRILDGFYCESCSGEYVKQYQETKDPYGDWVCINVFEMDFPRAYDVCVHECSHKAYSEIFAEKCEGNFIGCRELMEND